MNERKERERDERNLAGADTVELIVTNEEKEDEVRAGDVEDFSLSIENSCDCCPGDVCSAAAGHETYEGSFTLDTSERATDCREDDNSPDSCYDDWEQEMLSEAIQRIKTVEDAKEGQFELMKRQILREARMKLEMLQRE